MQHTVRISRDFYISKHEVTQGEYAARGGHEGRGYPGLVPIPKDWRFHNPFIYGPGKPRLRPKACAAGSPVYICVETENRLH
jgi:formylglycine-generating enzyme required for sulfatase activity